MNQVLRPEHGLDLGHWADAVDSRQREDLHVARAAEYRHRAALSKSKATADAAALLTLLSSSTVLRGPDGVPSSGLCPVGMGCTQAGCSSAAGGCCWGQDRSRHSAIGVAGCCCAPGVCSQADISFSAVYMVPLISSTHCSCISQRLKCKAWSMSVLCSNTSPLIAVDIMMRRQGRQSCNRPASLLMGRRGCVACQTAA